MSSEWGNMGDLNAAREFQRQVRRGNLNDGRSFRGVGARAHEGVTHVSSSFSSTSRGDRPNATGGDWGARLATTPPAHLFDTTDTITISSKQPTLDDDRGDPMVVDEHPDEPQSGLPMSYWGAASTTTASTAQRTMDSTNISTNTPRPVASSRGLAASNWGKPAAAVADPPPAPPAVPVVATGRGLSASNWSQSTSSAVPAPDPANIIPVDSQTTIASSTKMAEAKPSGPHSNTVQGASGTPATITTAQGAVAAGSDLSVEEPRNGKNLTASTSLPGPDHGLKQSRWAKQTAAMRANGQATTMNTIFGEDPGRIVDKDWIVTYQVEDGGRIYSLAAKKAREAGDRVAALSLHNVAELSAEIVRARTTLQDPAEEKQARDAANVAASQAVNAFHKYHPPHPKEIVRENTTFHSAEARVRDEVDGQSSHLDTAAQSAHLIDRPALPGPVGTIAQDRQSTAGLGTGGFPASLATQHQNNSCRESHAIEVVDPSARPTVARELQNSTVHSISKARPTQQQLLTVQQQPQTVQEQPQAVQKPAIIQESIPSSFDDPRARQMLEDCFFNRGKK